MAGYYVYWGPDPQGTSTRYLTTPRLALPVLPLAGSRVRPTYYLRIQTRDAVGNLAEWETVYRYTTDPVTKYYEFNGRRVALRQGGQVHYLFGDQIGSTSLVVDGVGRVVSEVRYRPWGEVRYNPGVLSTRYTYTGQYSHLAEFGLYFYNARWYSPTLGRFTQPDSVIPVQSQSVQGLDRYGYVNNNPLVYTDPSGHVVCYGGGYEREQCERFKKNQELYQAYLAGVNSGNWEAFDALLGIRLTTVGATWDTATWNGVTFNEAVAVRRGAMDVAFALGSVNNVSAAEAFREAFGTSASDRLEFRRVASFTYDANQDGVLETYTAGGVTRSRHLIVLANLSNWNFGTARNNVVHELGHAFNVAHGRHPQNFAGRYLGINAKLLSTAFHKYVPDKMR